MKKTIAAVSALVLAFGSTPAFAGEQPTGTGADGDDIADALVEITCLVLFNIPSFCEEE